MADEIEIQVYLKSNRVFTYKVASHGKAREHAKRIITEGFICDENGDCVYYPVERVFKVKIMGVPSGKYKPSELNL